MNNKYRLYTTAAILTAVTISFCSSELQNFKFDLIKVDNEQRDKLFTYLTPSNGLTLKQDQFNLLLRSLFAETKPIDKITEEKLFGLMDINGNKQIDKAEFDKIWDKWIKVILKPKSALIVVDMQNDFLADGGSMIINNAVSIVPVINKLVSSVNFDTVVYTFDWHPSNHCSFIDNKHLRPLLSANGKTLNNSDVNIDNLKLGDTVVFKQYPNLVQRLWPKHCVQNTEGAKLHKDLLVANNSFKAFKGMNPDIDSYSAFFDNGRLQKSELSDRLLEKGITDVYVSGVAYDYCAGSTANDSLYLGFRTALIEDASYGIEPQGMQNMRKKLIDSHASIINSTDVSDMVNGKDRRLEMGLVLAQKVFHAI